MKPVSILVIDDDEIMLDLLRDTLSEEGWTVITAGNGEAGLNEVEKAVPDLIILDIVMPGMDGFEVCHRLRQWSSIPIIALSALHDTKEKVKCLNLGTDDFITKPFKIDELIARINAKIRRTRTELSDTMQSTIFCDDITIDLDSRTVYVSDNEVRLRPKEFNILFTMVSNQGTVLTYADLLRRIWGQGSIDQREYLYVQVRHLREKIEADAKNPRHIISIPGVGYKFQK